MTKQLVILWPNRRPRLRNEQRVKLNFSWHGSGRKPRRLDRCLTSHNSGQVRPV